MTPSAPFHLSSEPDKTRTSVAFTLAACKRCRKRKTRCDADLPRCNPCKRAGSTCEYFDANTGKIINRAYVVDLQKKVRKLEEELQRADVDEGEDEEAMMSAATVRLHEAKDSKYLGPSSGIAITRLVMAAAKQFTGAASIRDIVPDQRAHQIREAFNQEHAKPLSKVNMLNSNVAAEQMPTRSLANFLVELYKLRVQPMYPALHEPTLDSDIDAVYDFNVEATPFQNFVCRMVFAISMQKIGSQWAGLADSYYLAALTYLKPVVRSMDLQTLQCFVLMAEYSLLTPTRTAIYFVVGIAVRLSQSLGYHEEATITRGLAEGRTNAREVDMRRRLFWCTLVMELGLAHSLGRPSILATSHEHINVDWFATCDDEYIRPEGIDPTAPPTLKKWVAIHFFKMRLLQLEIRRKLYQRKRPEPKDDQDPWFHAMEQKLILWRDDTPDSSADQGIPKSWFIGRYNTIVVLLYRPSPQVPRPSVEAALKCFEACRHNIYLQQKQMESGVIDVTWIFTQAIFMAINTMLWSLSYDEVRRKNPRPSVEEHLKVAISTIQFASLRWPGVESAVKLYENLISAILKVYDREGDVPFTSTPSDTGSGGRSHTTSPVNNAAALASGSNPAPEHHSMDTMANLSGITDGLANVSGGMASLTSASPQDSLHSLDNMPFDPHGYLNPLPDWQTMYTSYPSVDPSTNLTAGEPMWQTQQPTSYSSYAPSDGPWPMAFFEVYGEGIDESQQVELMQNLETDGIEDIQSRISQARSFLQPETLAPRRDG